MCSFYVTLFHTKCFKYALSNNLSNNVISSSKRLQTFVISSNTGSTSGMYDVLIIYYLKKLNQLVLSVKIAVNKNIKSEKAIIKSE